MSVEFRPYTAKEIYDLPTLSSVMGDELKIEETDEETGEGFRVWISGNHDALVSYERLINGRWRKCDEHGNEL